MTIEDIGRLYRQGHVAAASDWVRKQDDSFGAIQAMKNAGNLALLLAAYLDEHNDVAVSQ